MEIKRALEHIKEVCTNVKLHYSKYEWKIELETLEIDFSGKSKEIEKTNKLTLTNVNLKDLLERVFEEIFKAEIIMNTDYKYDLSDIENLTTNCARFDLRFDFKDPTNSYFREVYEKTDTVISYCICNIDEFCKRILKDSLIVEK